MPEDDPMLIEARRRAQENRIERFRRLAAQTENPLYIWQAIAYLSNEHEPLPDWCRAYIDACAWGIYDLIVASSGYDLNQVVYTSGKATASAIQMGLPDVKKRVEPRKAMEKVVNALELNRRSYNAFKALQNDNDLIEDATAFEFTQALRPPSWPQKTARDVVAQIRVRRSLNEDRAAKSRVKKGGTLR